MLSSESRDAPVLASAIERTCAILAGHDRQEVAALISNLAKLRGLDADILAVQAVTTLSPDFNIRRSVAATPPRRRMPRS
jgi:hypothetical protein